MSLWIPPAVSRELQEETLKTNEATLQMFDLETGLGKKWNKPNGPLRKLDSMMRVGKARPGANGVEGNGVPIVPGYWHLIRINPGQPIWAFPIHDNGKYAEPTDAMLQMLRNNDMQNEQVLRDKERMAIAEDKSKKREKERKRQEREDSMMEAWGSIYQPKINFSTDIPWTNSTQGKRGRKTD